MSEIDLITWIQYQAFRIVEIVFFFWMLLKLVTQHFQYHGLPRGILSQKSLTMANPKQIVISTKVVRHQPQFSRLVTIPLGKIAPWKLTETTMIEGTINEAELGRRSLKRWDEGKCWWIDLPEPLCKKRKFKPVIR